MTFNHYTQDRPQQPRRSWTPTRSPSALGGIPRTRPLGHSQRTGSPLSAGGARGSLLETPGHNREAGLKLDSTGVSRGPGVQAAGANEGWADPAPPGAGMILTRIFPRGLWALQTHRESLLGSGRGCFLLRGPSRVWHRVGARYTEVR